MEWANGTRSDGSPLPADAVERYRAKVWSRGEEFPAPRSRLVELAERGQWEPPAAQANRSVAVKTIDRPGFATVSSAPIQRKPRAKPAVTQNSVPCDHRGDVVRYDVSNLCGTRGHQIAIYACVLHGECSLGRYCRHQTVRSCATCGDCVREIS